MKKFLIPLLLVFAGCASNPESVTEYSYYGENFDPENAVSVSKALSLFTDKDTIQVKMLGIIDDVCQKKGCWMTFAIDEEEDVMVRFKDYDFFVPLDATGKEAIIEGVLFREVQSVEEQKHYASDAGSSEEEINEITEPLTVYSFEATGVLIKSPK
jgi:hypothetical protein